MRKLLATEPVVIVAVVQAGLVCAAAFGLDLTAEQIAGLVGFFSAVLALVVRQVVATPATVVAVARDVAVALSEETVGAVGTVTEEGAAVVDMIVRGTGGLVAEIGL